MTWPDPFQALCVVVLAIAYALYLRSVPRAQRRDALLELALIAIGAWAAEETSIIRYHAYGYPDWWWLKLDEVPLLIVAIWPMVVTSARTLVTALFPEVRGLRRVLLVGLVVVVDATLMEVLAVNARLWAWTLPGYMEVPLIGILGWAFYAMGITYALERWPRAWSPIIALAITHALLVVSWYACFKWASVELPLATTYLYVLAMVVGVFWLLRHPTRRMSLQVAVPRMIAASVFVVLLVTRSTEHLPSFHWLHLAATAMLYLTAVRWPGQPLQVPSSPRSRAGR